MPGLFSLYFTSFRYKIGVVNCYRVTARELFGLQLPTKTLSGYVANKLLNKDYNYHKDVSLCV